MKYYTEGLMNVKTGFSLLPGRKMQYYIAYKKEENTLLMWMEEKCGKKFRAYPCLIRSEEEIHPFVQKTDPDFKLKNEQLVLRWNERITRASIGTEYKVESLTETEFQTKYKELKNIDRGTYEN